MVAEWGDVLNPGYMELHTIVLLTERWYISDSSGTAWNGYHINELWPNEAI